MKNTSKTDAAGDHFIDQLADAVAARIAVHAPAATTRLLTVDGAAQYLGRTRAAVVHLIQRGVIPVTKIGGRMQVDRAVLDKLIEDNTYFES